MLIWRVENEKGEGCYREKNTQFILKRHNNNLTHPTPLQDKDIKKYPLRVEISGFINEEQAMEWFDERELRVLGTIGFKLKRIVVKRITRIGTKQLLAIR